MAIGVAVLAGDTKAKVTVNEGATNLTADKGKVSVDATTQSDVGVKVNAVGTTSYVSSNVGVANYDTSADVIINRSITAGAVDINAENKITGLKLTVDNTANTSAPVKDTEERNDTEDNNAAQSQGDVTNEKKSIDPTKLIKNSSVDTSNTQDSQTQDAAGAIQSVQNRVAGTNESGTNGSGNNSQPTSAFGLGTSVGVVSNKNDANIKIGKNVVISATPVTGGGDGSVNVKANMLMIAPKDEADSTKFKEDTLQFTVKNTQANSAKVEIGAAVLVSNVKNNATVLMDDDESNSARITGGAVSLDAKAGMGEYGEGAAKKTSVLTYTVGAEGTAADDNPSKFALEGSVGVNTLKNNAIVLLGQNSVVNGSAVKLSSDATTNAQGTYGATDNNTTVGLGGTVGIQNIRGNSLVMAGKGVQITGTESFEASANNEMDLKNNVQNAGKGISVGVSGMVALSYGDSNSIVSLDDEAKINTGFATISSMNSTNIENSAISNSAGLNGAKAFGIGVGIVNYDVNSLAMVSDNGSGITEPSGNTTDAEKAAQKIYQDSILARKVAQNALAVDDDTLTQKLGAKTGGTKGSINTGGLMGSAITTGMIQNDAKAKAVSDSQDDGDENSRTDSERWNQWSNQGTTGANEARTNTENLEQDNVTSQNESAAPSASGAGREAGSAANPDGDPAPSADSDGDSDSSNTWGTQNGPAGASIGIEGSVALTFLGGRTDAILDNVTVKNETKSETEGTEAKTSPVAVVSLSATDFLGSITLGGTTTKHSVNDDSSNTKVGIGGTFAMNSSNRDVDSLIRNSDLQQVLFVSNSASKTGIEVAAGMGVATAKGDGANINGAGVVYYNRAKQDISALMINTNVTGVSVSNGATSTDFQIAGGLAGTNSSGSNTNVGVGGAVAISNLENNLSSGIIGGEIITLGSVDVEAQKGTTQINAALAGTKGGYGFEGAFSYGSTKNTTRAYIEGNASVTSLGAVNVKAGEVPVIKTDEQLQEEKTKIGNKIDSSLNTELEKSKNPNVKTQKPLSDTIKNKVTGDSGLKKQAQDALQKESDTQKQHKQTLDNAGLDTTGASYLDKSGDEESSLDEDSKKLVEKENEEKKKTTGGQIADEAAKDESDAKDELGKNDSITITAAMGGGWNGEVGAGVGIAYNYVKNDIAANIKGSTVIADTVKGEAASDSLIVSVGAGIAVGGSTFNGAGSGSWNDLKNDTKVTFENNTISAKTISEKAQNDASIINIAGEVAGGSGSAIGLSLAYNSLNNTTGTYLKGNTVYLTGEANNANDANSVILSSTNTGKAVAVAGGVNVEATSKGLLGAAGTVAINRGINNTESVIDGKTTGVNTTENTTLNNVKELSVTATDLTKKTTVAGAVSVGGTKVGIGGAVAYTSVGTSGNKERLRAEVNHADIITTETGTITVSTKDNKTEGTNTEKSRITTVGAGIGVSWGQNYFNLHGAAAVSDIYKDSRAALNNTNINNTSSTDTSNTDTSNTSTNVKPHPTISVTADTKSKINTVGAVGNISISGKVSGTAGIAINRMHQDTTAEMNTDSGTTTINAGLTQVRAIGDADIHSVGVGGTVAVNEYVSFAGSGSYNYIDNDVEAIVKNQNLTSDKNVGVVAQSDDRIYNFAGGFAIGANTRAGIGAAVSINKITGNTNALVSGGSIVAAGTSGETNDPDRITVSRPQDTKLYNAETLNLTTDRTRLSERGTNETKTGIVVDSSATHTLISQLSSGGVAASSSVGVELTGTVNLNTIQGETTAKIQDADLNKAEDPSDVNPSNVNVNAVDYANIGSFTGTPAIGVGALAGISIGVSANWETLSRTTAAEISSSSKTNKKYVYAKDLTVDAIAKHGSNALSFAAAASGGKVGVASGDSIMRHNYNNTTTASLKNVKAFFDVKADIKAEHLGNSLTQNIAATISAGMAAVSVGAGVSVLDDTSTVKAEVDNSELKAKANADGTNTDKDITVLAKNENNSKNTLVTAGLAAGIGAALVANVGIYNTTGETATLVTNSNLEAHKITVKATDKLTVNSTGGVGAGGLGGVGVAVILNNINSSVSAHVTGGDVKASNNIEVAADETRNFEGLLAGASAGGLGVGVNVGVTSVNKGITDAQLSNAKDENGNSTKVGATTQDEIKKHIESVNGAKGALVVKDKDGNIVKDKDGKEINVKFYGLSASDQDIAAAKNSSVDLSVPSTKTQGVHTSIGGGAILTADGNVDVKATDTSDIHQKQVGVTAGLGGSVNVTDAIIHTNYDTDVTLNNATVKGKNVNINALQTQAPAQDGKQGSDVTVTAVTVGALGGVGVGYAGIVNKGSTDVNITGSTIQSTGNSDGDNGVTINATDESKHKSEILSVGVAALNVTTTFASVENYSNVGVTLNDTNNISATKDITIDAKKANELEAHTQGVGVGGVNVAVNHATIEEGGKIDNRDTGLVTAKITGTNGTFTADKFHLGATNDTTAKLSAGNTAVSVLGISTMRGKGVMDMGAEVNVAGGSFNAKTVEFASMLGNANGRTIEGNVKGHNISVGAVAPDTVRLATTATGKVNVANSTFGENTNLILDNESYVDRKGYIYDVTVGGVAVGNSRAIISGTETLTTTLMGQAGTTNKLTNLVVATYGENKGKALADAGGGGLVGYFGAHVDNKSTNTVKSILSGKWDLTGEAYLVAAQKDETRLTAKEGHGGVIGVGGTSVENTIKTTTDATVEENTEITADRVHVGTANSLTTGAYDDKDGNGKTDAQTYTLQDHFGGAISGNRLRSLLDVTENGTVTIDKNAKITTNKLQEYVATSNNDLTNNASAKGGAAVGVTDAVTENILTINNTVNVNSGATLSNEKAASTEDIILAAYDEHKLKSHAEATVGGAVGVMVSKNITTMNRTSNVNVAGNIESSSNVGLYAGANEDGVLSNLNADLKAGAYNHTAIPISTPRVRYNKDGDDKDIGQDLGTVNVSGIVRSARDINVIASSGKEEVVKDQSLFNWVLGGSSTEKKFLSSDAVVAEEAMPKLSTVNVIGSLIAGTGDAINIAINGTVKGTVEGNNESAEYKPLSFAYISKEGNSYTYIPNNPNANENINLTNQRVLNGITQGTFDYANTLGARLTELNRLIAAYAGKSTENENNGKVMAAYIAERDRIQNEMVRLGLTEKGVDKDGNETIVYVNSGRPVYYVEIPDISTGGGNINVMTNHFIGKGKLHANSAPGITITNNSDAYLKLNNITMGEQGGKITYNGKDNIISPGESRGNEDINNINVSKTGASFSEIYGVTSNGEDGADLNVNNAFNGSKKSTITVTDNMKVEMRQEITSDPNLSQDEKTSLLSELDNLSSNTTFDYTAITDVEVNGKISNFYGNVRINNNSGDIRISGGTTNRPTGVSGNTVTLTAANGTIAQDYKEGIVNINGNPENYLADDAASLKTEANNGWQGYYKTETLFPGTTIEWTFTYPDSDHAGQMYSTKTKNYNRSNTSQEATGYIAGRDVYVSAANINVNGLIQSGYKSYSATVSDTDLIEARKRPASRATVVQNRTMYKVNDGGAKWSNTDNAFYYEAQVYWDPSTNKLVVEDIDTQGGKIYLTGNISSTGDGRILAADGAAIITVTNETALDMNVGKVLNNQREGVITIADTANDTWTEYRKGQTRIISVEESGMGYAAYLDMYGKLGGDLYANNRLKVKTNNLSVENTNNTNTTNTLTYTPKANQTYNWTKGDLEERTVIKQHYVRYGMWGLVKTKDVNEVKGDTKNITEISPEQLRKEGLPEGAVIVVKEKDDDVPGVDIIRVDANSYRLNSNTSDVTSWVEKTGFLGWFKNCYTRWKEGTTTAKIYNYSINASQGITIGLIGSETGKIDIQSGGSINLTDNVANSHNQAELNISSTAGGITQFDNTTLKSEIVNLTAKDDIKNIHLASVGTVTKDAEGNITSVTDNIKLSAISTNKGDIDITAVGGGVLEGHSLPGNVQIVALKSQGGSSAFKNDAALGDVTLMATGNITQLVKHEGGTVDKDGIAVEGRGISLTSKNGGIGTADQAINIAGSDVVYSTDRYGAQVNASAKKDIYLTEAAVGDDTTNDMRVGKIESMEGDVKLTVTNGGFIDGMPHDDKSGSRDSVDEMVHRWIDAGLIDGEKDTQGNYTYKGAYITGLEKERDDYKADVERAYTGKTNEEWQAEYLEKKTEVENIYASTEYSTYLENKANYANLSPEERKELVDSGNSAYLAYVKSDEKYSQYSNYETADAFMQAYKANLEAEYQNSLNRSKEQWNTDLTTLRPEVERIYASAEYKAYLANKTKYDNLSPDDRRKLAEAGDSEFLAYVHYSKYSKYDNAEAYLNDTAAYKYSQYNNAEAYLAADATYTDLASKAANPTFEWTKDMMLYAVSDKLVNPKGGGSTQTDGVANVVGKNITLNATKGAVGTFDNQTTTITVEDLTGNDRIAKMKELMNVSASDVTVNKDTKGNILSFVIKKNMPLGVFQKENANNEQTEPQTTSRLDVSAGGDVFIAGRENPNEKGTHSAINVGSIDATKGSTAGDVRLHSEKGIYNALTTNDTNQTNITGNNLILTGGKESIGASDKPLTVSLTTRTENVTGGDLIEARADKNVFIKNMNNNDYLRLGAMYAGDTISLNSDKGFLMSNANGEIAKSYINAGKSLVFNADAETGVVGDANHAIRILNNQTPVNITAGTAYVWGVDNSDIQNGTLMLGDIITAGDFTAVGDGSIAVGRDEEKDENGTVVTTAIDGSITSGGNVTLDAKDSLTLDGEVKAGDLENAKKTLTLKAVNGDITQTAKGAITADAVNTFNGKSLLLENENNKFNSITVDGIVTENGEKPAIAGNVRIKDKSDALTVAVKRDVTGDISVENRKTGGTLTNSGNLTATGNIGLKADGNLTQAAGTTLNAGKDVNLTSTNGSIAQNVTEGTTTGIQAQKVTTVSAKKVDLQGTGNQFDVLTAQSSGANAPIQGGVLIKDSTDKLALSIQPSVIGPITVENTKDNGAIQVTSELQAKTQGTDTGTLTLKSDGSMQIDKNVTADSDVVLTSVSGAMTIGGNVSASNNITLTSKETMQTTGKLTAVNNVTATSTNGAMTIGGDVTTTTGDIKLQSNGNMQTTGKLTAKQNANSDNPTGNVNLTSTAGNVTVGGDVTTGTTSPELVDSDKDGIPELKGIYNSLTIHAGGAIQETDGVKIDTPVVETYSGKGVSMESKNNTFGYFLSDALEGNIINGSIKAVTSYAEAKDDKVFTAGVGASVLGDVEFTNLHKDGGLGLLILHPEQLEQTDTGVKEKEIKVLGGNGAKGNLVLKASQDVGLLGDASAAHDIVVDSANGSFYGIGKGIAAGNDVNVSVGDAVYYISGTDKVNQKDKALYAGNDIIIETKNSTTEDAGIYIGALPENVSLMDDTAPVAGAPTKLWAGRNANFNVNGNGDIDLKGDVMARDGEVAATISGKGDITVGTEDAVVNPGEDVETSIMAKKNVTLETKEGNIKVSKGIQSTEESVSVQTGKGDITVGRDNVVDGKTITAKKDVSVGTDLGTIYIQGETSTETGDITMKAGKDKYKVGTDNENFVIRDDGKVNSGGGVGLYGRNGDIHITDDISAKKGLTASITEQGNVYFETNVSVTNDVNITTEKGDISIGADVTAGNDVKMKVNTGNVTVGSSGQGNVVATNGDVTVDISGKGNVSITKSVDSQNGSVSVKTKEGDINIGSANVKDDKTVTAKENVNVETDLGTIYILGMTSTETGDITMKAGKDTYLPDTGSDENLVQNGNFIIKDDGKLNAGGAVNLKGRNGDIHITDAIEAQKGITTSITEKGNVYFEKDVTVKDDVNITTEDGNIAIGKTVTSTEGNVNLQTGTGSILIGEDVTAEKDVTITTKEGSVIVGDTDTGGDGDVLSKKGDVSIQTGEGVVGIVKSVKAQEGSIDIQVGTGGVTIGNNGPKEKTVTAYKNIDVAVELGRIEIYGKTSTQTGDISMSAAESTYVPGGQNIIIDAVKAVRNLNATVLDEGDISLDRDVNVIGNTTVTINGKGSVFGHNIVSGGTTHVALTNGDLFLNLAEGKAVVLRMENNTAASRVNTVKADASGGAGLDVELTGNFIQIGTVEAKGGNSVLQLSAIGAGNQKLISGEISVGSLHSRTNTHMPTLWANRGNIHVDEGDLAIDDVLAVDKIHLENKLTDLAIFGRTPTRDGEQLYYWNNLELANSKTRPFTLYADGKVRTHRAVLIDAGRYYGKLYGDNLSVVDMMRERLTNEHGQYTFDRTWYTKPGEALKEKVLFGMDTVDEDIRRHNASSGQLM